jgi:hypothetical protein
MKNLSTYHRIYLIQFNNQSHAHLSSGEGINTVLNENKEALKSGIKFIKVSETTIPKFKRVSKDNLNAWIGYNTEAMEILKDSGFLTK